MSRQIGLVALLVAIALGAWGLWSLSSSSAPPPQQTGIPEDKGGGVGALVASGGEAQNEAH